MRSQGYFVAAAALSGMLIYGALASGALWLARHRASKRTLRLTWVVVVGTGALVLSMAGAWLNTGLGGNPTVSAVLIGIAVAGLIGIQLVIAGWTLWERVKRDR
jgi:hypothetical protein